MPGFRLGRGDEPLWRSFYRYDDRDGSLECLTCRHGALTTNNAGTNAEAPNYDFRLSADGSTVAFATGEPLLKGDINRGIDIYVWRNGATSLISDGITSFQDGFAAPKAVAVDADGTNLFFSIASPGLTGFEQDRLANLYDARIGGGFVPPPPPTECVEDSCQGSLLAAPALSTPGSASESRGNPPPARAKRPCAKKQGKAKRRCRQKQRRGSQQGKRAKQGKERSR